MLHLFPIHLHTPPCQTPDCSCLSIWQTIPYPNDVVASGNAGDFVCVCVCEYILNLPMPGLNGCTDCNSRCKRFMKRLREILLDGHRNGSSLALSGSVVHENDFAVGKTIDYDLYRRPHETVLRHCAERLHILFLTNCEVATSKRFMCTSQC